MKLTQEEKRIKIAEALGWTPSPCGRWTRDPSGLRGPFRDEPPNYFGDLNAKHKL